MTTNNRTRKPDKGKERKLIPISVTGTTPAEDNAAIVLDTRFVGQHEARRVALEIVARATNPLRDKTRPIACVLLVGKSRTGKTRLAELVAEIVGAELLKINCSNYKERHHASRFIGSPTGYYGWDDPAEAKKPGKSTAAKLNNANIIAHRGTKIPVTVALLDEVDELHRSLDNLILSIMDKGELDMGNNEVADFRNVILFMTTNLGMKQAEQKKRKQIGFTAQDKRDEPVTVAEIKESVDEALKERYEPQWLNRLDDTIIFGSLTEDQIRSILDVELDRFVVERIDKLPKGKYFGIEVEASAKEFILGKALANSGDVSNLRRAIQMHLSDPLGKALKTGAIPGCAKVIVQHVEGDALSFFIAEGEKVAGGTGDDADAADPRGQNRGLAAEVEDDESEDRVEGQAIQRRINRAAQGAQTGNLVVFDVILHAKTKASLTTQSGQFVHDATEVYDMELVSVSTQFRAPWAAVFIVECTNEQMDQLKAVYGRDPKDSPNITIRPHQGEIAK